MTARAWSPWCKASRPSAPAGPRRRRLAKLHADKGYDYDHLRRWLRSRNISPRIARNGIESSQRLGRHRGTVERTVAWLSGCRRLHRRCERKSGTLPGLRWDRRGAHVLPAPLAAGVRQRLCGYETFQAARNGWPSSVARKLRVPGCGWPSSRLAEASRPSQRTVSTRAR